MTPEDLAAYLAVLPRNTHRIELVDGDFSVRMELTGASLEPEYQKSEASQESETAALQELREFFPQLGVVK